MKENGSMAKKFSPIVLGISLIFELGILERQVIAENNNLQNPIPIEIGLSLSGGGVRAAAFSYGIMRGLDEITLCVTKKEDEKDKDVKRIVEIRNVFLSKVENSGEEECPEVDRHPLLAEVGTLSAVSGGSMTAIYYMTHDDQDFREDFRDMLKERNLTLDLIGGMKARSNFGGGWPLAIPLLFTSAIDTIKDMAFLPFSWMLDQGWPFPNPDLTPALFLTTSRGLINSERLAEIYEDWFFDGDSLTFEDIHDSRKKRTEILINATDVKNKRHFTFDPTTFNCLGVGKEAWNSFPLALASAASSALPVLFAPLDLEKHLVEFRKVEGISTDCPPLLFDKSDNRKPELLDGGLRENLGLASLVRKMFREKNNDKPSLKTFLIVVNSAAPSAGALPSFEGESTMIQNVDGSLDTLQRDKTDLARTIYREPLNNFGFASIEFQFSDIKNLPGLNNRIAQIILEGKGHTRQSVGPQKILENSALFTEEAERVRQDLETIGMNPTKDQIDTLIAAGRAVVHLKFQNIKAHLEGLSKRKYLEHCADIVNPEKFYCWPKSFEGSNILESPLRLILKDFSETTEAFIKSTTENRLRRLKEIQGKGLVLRTNLERWAKVERITNGSKMDDLLKKDAEYYRIKKNMAEEVNDLEEFTNALRTIREEVTDEMLDHRILLLNENQKKASHAALAEEEEEKERQKINNNLNFKSWYVPAIEYLRRGSPFPSCSRSNQFVESHTEAMCEFVGRMNEKMNNETVGFTPLGKKLVSSHWFYMISAFLNLALDRYDDVFYYLYAGLKKYPEEMNFYNYQGYYTYLIDGNIKGGVRYFQRAIDIAKLRQNELVLDLVQTYEVKKSRLINRSMKRFERAQNMYTRVLSEYLALSPVILTEELPTEEIQKFLIENFPDPDDKGGTVVRKGYRRRMPWSLESQVKEYVNILDAVTEVEQHGNHLNVKIQHDQYYVTRIHELQPNVARVHEPKPFPNSLRKVLDTVSLAKASGLDLGSLKVKPEPVVNVAHGSLTINPENVMFIYTPNANFVGTDSFVYEVSDRSGEKAQATVTLNATEMPKITLKELLEDKFSDKRINEFLNSLIQAIYNKVGEKIRRDNLGFNMAKRIYQENVNLLGEEKNLNYDDVLYEPVPGLMKHEILYPYGLHLLVASAEFECPRRETQLKTATDLLKNSKLFLLESLQTMVNTAKDSPIFKDLFQVKEIQEKIQEMKDNPYNFHIFRELIVFLLITEEERQGSILKVLAKNSTDVGVLKDFVELLYDLQFIDSFLKYADELECVML